LADTVTILLDEFSDDLVTVDATNLQLTISTEDPSKVGIDYSNNPNNVLVHTRSITAFVEGLPDVTRTETIEIQVLPTC